MPEPIINAFTTAARLVGLGDHTNIIDRDGVVKATVESRALRSGFEVDAPARASIQIHRAEQILQAGTKLIETVRPGNDHITFLSDRDSRPGAGRDKKAAGPPTYRARIAVELADVIVEPAVGLTLSHVHFDNQA